MPPSIFTTPDNPPPTSTTPTTSSKLSYILLFLLLTIPIPFLFLLRSLTDSSTLRCLESHHPSSSILYPHINWERIPPLPPALPNFHFSRWIVVHLPSHSPPSSLRPLARIPGWQLLAVPDHSNNNNNNNLSLPHGAILLTPQILSLSGFRVSHFLPPLSHLRKTAAYLFAIRHGATKILDADHLLQFNSSLSFDLHLLGDDAPPNHRLLLQYSHHDPNRTVVNPYVHFGQRSVWPRGLPLDRVGDVSSEDFYTQVLSGNQFIQQGLTDGLPDVDHVFYRTRKPAGEPLEIRFDGTAPEVALPPGVMAPANALNALFDRRAFWGLMLPVSVGPMASDVIRGYWAQRMLWEIGGCLAVCPPAAYRVDRGEIHPFAEENEVHVNVGRLIEFLVRWRSKKHTLFDRILDLSYAMAVEGFWTEEDVRYTAHWLQDLVAVGYRQPRLMSLEIDLPRAAIGHGDRKEFVPLRLPTVHLGVEEVGEVSAEIGNLVRWRRYFGNVVLIMYCGRPVERTAMEWRLLYGRIFKTVVILSEDGNGDLAVERGNLSQAYRSLPRIFERYTGADGFIFLQDSVILNYWNLLQADKTKLWTTNKVSESWTAISVKKDTESWVKSQAALVQKLVSSLPVHFQANYKKNMGKQAFAICGGEIFYVPRRFVGDFHDLVRLVGDSDLHHVAAMPLFFMAMDLQQNFDSDALGSSIYKRNLPSNTSYSSYYSSHVPAVYPCNVHSKADFVKLIRIMASGDLLLMKLV